MTRRARWRKGLTMNEATLGLIVVVIVTLVFLIWFYNLQGQFGKLKDTKACELSVIEASKAGTGSFIELQCSTRMIVIKSDGAYQSSLRGTDGARQPSQEKYISYEEIARRLERKAAGQPIGAAIAGTKRTKQEILREMGLHALATEMAACWTQFGQGSPDIDPFKSNVLLTKSRCVTCATVHFDESYRRDLGASELKDFVKYLQDTRYDAKAMSYYDFLRPTEFTLNTVGTGAVGFVSPLLLYLLSTSEDTTVRAEDAIKLNEDYVVTYSYLDAAWFAKAGVSKNDASVFLWPIDFRPSCDVLY